MPTAAAVPTRERIVYASAELFRRQGYAGTGLKQIAAGSDATLGSVYHFFPGGKEQLADEVLRAGGRFFLALYEAIADGAPDLVSAVRDFFAGAGETLLATDFADACPIATVAGEIASTHEVLRVATADVFESWLGALAKDAVQAGVRGRARAAARAERAGGARGRIPAEPRDAQRRADAGGVRRRGGARLERALGGPGGSVVIDRRSALLGAGAAIAARAVLPHAIGWKLRRDVRRLNAGDYGPLLSGYAEDAVLHFNEGPHRWSGEHRGKPAIERFLREFVGAGIKGEIRSLWTGGAPWALTLVVRFDDRATGPAGEELYANRVVIVARTRWGKIVEHEDFYLDTARIVAFEEKLGALGMAPVAV